MWLCVCHDETQISLGSFKANTNKLLKIHYSVSILQVPPISMACKKVLSMDCSKDSKYVVISQPAKTDLSLKVRPVLAFQLP